jgi:peptide-methionine (S)-S-oxide reductase
MPAVNIEGSDVMSSGDTTPFFTYRLRTMISQLLAVALLFPIALCWQDTSAHSSETAVLIPVPAMDAPREARSETAVLAGGCFWGVQGVFQHVKGVTSAVSGYSGGTAETARYEAVGSGRTGHAEAVKVTFDPQQISYGQILQIYFSVVHDPTELDRQGPDTGPQYRSAIFPANADQTRVAEAYIDQLNRAGVFPKPIATRIEAFKGFYPAEAYHQDFLTRNPSYPYIVINDLPKIDNLKQLFAPVYRAQPVLVANSSG